LLTINRLEAARSSTQSYSVVSRSHRVDIYAPRAMRRCAKLIDKIGHEQSDGRASVPGGAGALRPGCRRGKKGRLDSLVLAYVLLEKLSCTVLDSDEATRIADQGQVVAEGQGAP
jgi:hypothetical protein